MWQVIVPVKNWDAAKSRLQLPAAARRALAEAMARDTINAVTRCALVSHVIVLTTGAAAPPGARASGPADFGQVDRVLTQPPQVIGLQQGLEWAGDQLDSAAPLAVVVADLPALTSEHLGQTLQAADGLPAAMVADRHGAGTTVLTATSQRTFRPAFGVQSAAAHRGRLVITLDPHQVPPTVACDVDTLDDLAHASALGLGALTRRIADSLGSPHD